MLRYVAFFNFDTPGWESLPAVAMSSGHTALDDGWWLVWFTVEYPTDANLQSDVFGVAPDDAVTGSAFEFTAINVVDDVRTPVSPILTPPEQNNITRASEAGGTVLRYADFPAVATLMDAPQGAVYLRYVAAATSSQVDSVNSPLIGPGPSPNQALLTRSWYGKVHNLHDTGTDTANATLPTLAVGDVIEVLASWQGGQKTITLGLNGGAGISTGSRAGRRSPSEGTSPETMEMISMVCGSEMTWNCLSG